jgi:hypothetical protein
VIFQFTSQFIRGFPLPCLIADGLSQLSQEGKGALDFQEPGEVQHFMPFNTGGIGGDMHWNTLSKSSVTQCKIVDCFLVLPENTLSVKD